jgi:hypothetical protein
MKTALRLSIIIVAIAISSVTVRASSIPIVNGQVSGIEVCSQAMCTVAVFVGGFRGQIGFIPHAVGTMAVAVHHGPLPVVEDLCTPIPDGVWTLLTWFRKIEGVTAGRLCYNGDNTYHISMRMLITSGGLGQLFLEGTLDHNVFPPAVRADVTQ